MDALTFCLGHAVGQRKTVTARRGCGVPPTCLHLPGDLQGTNTSQPPPHLAIIIAICWSRSRAMASRASLRTWEGQGIKSGRGLGRRCCTTRVLHVAGGCKGQHGRAWQRGRAWQGAPCPPPSCCPPCDATEAADAAHCDCTTLLWCDPPPSPRQAAAAAPSPHPSRRPCCPRSAACRDTREGGSRRWLSPCCPPSAAPGRKAIKAPAQPRGRCTYTRQNTHRNAPRPRSQPGTPNPPSPDRA